MNKKCVANVMVGVLTVGLGTALMGTIVWYLAPYLAVPREVVVGPAIFGGILCGAFMYLVALSTLKRSSGEHKPWNADTQL